MILKVQPWFNCQLNLKSETKFVMLISMEICASSARVSKTLANSLMYVTIWVRTETRGSGAAEVTRDEMEDIK